MNKKGMTLEALVRLLVAIPLILVFAWLIMRVMSNADSQTLNSFKTLGAEIKDLIDELEDKDKAEIVVPAYIHKEWAIGAINKGASTYPKQCRGLSCLVLSKKDLSKITNVIKFKNVEFTKSEDYLQSPEGGIIKVKVRAEKKDKKIIISMEKISSS